MMNFPIWEGLIGHHFVSLTSTTYGLLTLDPPLSPDSFYSLSSLYSCCCWIPIPSASYRGYQLSGTHGWPRLQFHPQPQPCHGTFCFSPLRPPFSYSNSKPLTPKFSCIGKGAENINPNMAKCLFTPVNPKPQLAHVKSLEGFRRLCPIDGEDKVVLYTTSLRGIRSTFEACNAVRSILHVLGVSFCERDISMDRGFREELRRLLLPLAKISPLQLLPPRLFIKGRYVGTTDEVHKCLRSMRKVVFCSSFKVSPGLRLGQLVMDVVMAVSCPASVAVAVVNWLMKQLS